MKTSNTSERLKELIDKRNLKQVDILEKTKPYCAMYGEKINKSHLSQWVSGVNEPNQRKLTILSQALGVDEVWLMGYDVPMTVELNKNVGDDLAEIYMNKRLLLYTSKLLNLTPAQQEIVYNMIDALSEKGGE